MTEAAPPQTVTVVIPVYRGEQVLPGLVDEIVATLPVTEPGVTPDGHRFQVTEVVLVHDNGPDRSDVAIRGLAEEYPVVRPLWLSRNFGQHAATLAGMAASSGDWIVTMDEDGQHDPADIPRLLDTALAEQRQPVYARLTNPPPHGSLRNSASRGARWTASRILTSGEMRDYHSFRLVLGEIGRALAAYGGYGVYLDVALTWLARPAGTCPVTLRNEHRPSGYSLRSLTQHMGRLVVTSGARPLRMIAIAGAFVAVVGFLIAAWVLIRWAAVGVQVAGWASVMIAVLVLSGVTLLALGAIAEYLAVAVRMAMGRPPYLVVGDPADGPLGRR